MDPSGLRSSFLFEALCAPLCTLVIAMAAWTALADHHEFEAAAAPEPREAEQEAAGSVSRASFTTAIVEREPVGEIVSLTEETDEVLFFSELLGLEGHTVTHRWEFDGEVVAEVPFQIGGPRWRVHSSKRLQPSWSGEWSVEVIDETGAPLTRKAFTYAPDPQPQPPAPEPAAKAADSKAVNAAMPEVARPPESVPRPAAPSE